MLECYNYAMKGVEYMNLENLLDKIKYEIIGETSDLKSIDIDNVAYDSRKVNEGSLFICISGAVVDGHSFVCDVATKKARAIIVEKDIDIDSVRQINDDIVIIKVSSTRKALAYVSANYFDHPADKIKTIGITGTKGNTTTTYMVKSILEKSWFKV